MSTDEVEKLIALAKEQPNDGDETIELTEFDEFALELNLTPGGDKLPFMLIFDYFKKWSKSKKPNQEKLGNFLATRLEKWRDRNNRKFYLVDESKLTVSRETMKREIGTRLYEQRKIKREKETEG